MLAHKKGVIKPICLYMKIKKKAQRRIYIYSNNNAKNRNTGTEIIWKIIFIFKIAAKNRVV